MAELTYRSGDGVLGAVFGVFIRPQTYLNLVYLYLAFPLGIAYFVFIVVGLSLGFGLIITLFGAPLLVLTVVVSSLLSSFERELANRLLNEEIPPILWEDFSGLKLLGKLKALLSSPVTWTGLLFLIVKFPIGVASFILATLLLAGSVALLAAPIYYRLFDVDFGFWRVDSLGEAMMLVPVGIVMTIVTPHVLNFAAFLSGRLAYLMLGVNWWGPARGNAAH